MNKANNTETVESYRFHHIDTNKCRQCTSYDCEEACFRGIYLVINKDTEPKCIIIEDREDRCIKCHICTTKCKFGAIIID